MRASSIAVLAMGLAGCAAGLELSVDVRSDLVVGLEVDEAVVVVERSGQELRRSRVALGASDDLVDGVRLADLSALSPGAYRVRVSLRRGGVDVAERSQAFELAGDLAVLITLTRACGDDGCEPAPCSSPTECVTSSECLRAACVGRVCLAVPDDARCAAGSCHPVRGCGPSDRDAGPVDSGPPGDAGGRDAGPRPTDAGPGCAVLDCADPACAGRGCDDGDACTYADVCDMGRCGGRPIRCDDGPCVTRTCVGTATCRETPRADGAACTDDGEACTDDLCRAGTCAHEPRPDGTGLGGFRMCCGGIAVDSASDRRHCGGCGLACAGSFACTMYGGRPMCDCASNRDCQGGAGWLCSTTYGLVCACTSSAGCPGTSSCVARSGPDYCAY